MEAQGLADLLTALPSTNQPTRQTPHAAFAEREMVAAYDNLSLRFAARIPLPSNELVGNAEVGASATQTAPLHSSLGSCDDQSAATEPEANDSFADLQENVNLEKKARGEIAKQRVSPSAQLPLMHAQRMPGGDVAYATHQRLECLQDTVAWLEEIVETCCDSVVRQQHKLKALELRFASPSEARAEQSEAKLSDLLFILRKLENENEQLKSSWTQLDQKCRKLADELEGTRAAAARTQDEMRLKMRAKDAESERLLQILQDVNYESMNYELVSKENQNLKSLLRAALDKSAELTELNKTLQTCFSNKGKGAAYNRSPMSDAAGELNMIHCSGSLSRSVVCGRGEAPPTNRTSGHQTEADNASNPQHSKPPGPQSRASPPALQSHPDQARPKDRGNWSPGKCYPMAPPNSISFFAPSSPADFSPLRLLGSPRKPETSTVLDESAPKSLSADPGFALTADLVYKQNPTRTPSSKHVDQSLDSDWAQFVNSVAKTSGSSSASPAVSSQASAAPRSPLLQPQISSRGDNPLGVPGNAGGTFQSLQEDGSISTAPATPKALRATKSRIQERHDRFEPAVGQSSSQNSFLSQMDPQVRRKFAQFVQEQQQEIGEAGPLVSMPEALQAETAEEPGKMGGAFGPSPDNIKREIERVKESRERDRLNLYYLQATKQHAASRTNFGLDAPAGPRRVGEGGSKQHAGP